MANIPNQYGGNPPQGSAPFDKCAWANIFLKNLGNSQADTQDKGYLQVVRFVTAWETQESGNNPTIGCSHNPLNTCETTPTSSPCGVGCVQAYDDPFANDLGYMDGVQATVAAMNGGNYPSLLNALQKSDTGNLGLDGGTMATNIQGDLTVWSTGQRAPININYINAILSIASQGNVPCGADIGQVTPVSLTAPLTGGLLAGINVAAIAKGAMGGLLLIVGLALFIRSMSSGIKGFL
jgi:hypothetical protein